MHVKAPCPHCRRYTISLRVIFTPKGDIKEVECSICGTRMTLSKWDLWVEVNKIEEERANARR